MPDNAKPKPLPSCGNAECRNPLCNGTVPVPSKTARVNDPRLSQCFHSAAERAEALLAAGIDPVAWAKERLASAGAKVPRMDLHAREILDNDEARR